MVGMLERFNSKLINIMKSKKGNSGFLTKEKYDDLLKKVSNSKNKTSGKKPEDYQRLKRYDIIKVDNVEKLIYPISKGSSYIRFYVYFEELFTIIHEVHTSIGHGGRNRMLKELQKKYKNITTEEVMVYLNLCESCQKKSKVSKKGLRPMNSVSFLFIGPLIHSVSLKNLEFIPEGILVVSNGKIVFIKNNSNDLVSVKNRFGVADEDVYTLEKGQFLIPGFIDTHIHGPQYPNAGLGYDLPLLQWLEKYTFPLESKFEDEIFAEKIYSAVVKKTLSHGTTTACYFATIHENSSCTFAECVKKLGQRAFVGKVNMNQNSPTKYKETFEESMDSTLAFVERVLALKSDLVNPIVTPRFALSCDMQLMKALGGLAAELKLPIQTHISENVEEVKKVHEEFPACKNYVDVYDKAGLITNQTILAHGIHLDPEELDVIKKKGATISHCPASNTLLQSGICPVRRYLDAGIKMSLGTDISGGSSCSILNCIRETLFLSIQASLFKMGEKLSLDEIFYMATLGGAEAVALGGITGNFMVGKEFDAILVDMNNEGVIDLLEDYTLEQLFQKFIHLGDDRVMKKVYVAGRIVKQL